MGERSRLRRLLLFGMAVALIAHLWMLHDPMPAVDGGGILVPAESTTIRAGQTAPGPPGGGHASGMPFMALTCLAVLLGAAAPVLLAALRRREPSPDHLARVQVGRRVHAPRRPPPVPPPNRVDLGVLLVL